MASTVPSNRNYRAHRSAHSTRGPFQRIGAMQTHVTSMSKDIARTIKSASPSPCLCAAFDWSPITSLRRLPSH